MKFKDFEKLTDRYKKGKCSDREKALIEKYLGSYQKNGFNWDENEMGDYDSIEKKLYTNILSEINKKKSPLFYKTIFSPYLLNRAASILFLIIFLSGVIFLTDSFFNKIQKNEWIERTALSGEKSAVTLSDGSVINLNSGSILRYPSEFNNSTREVILEGEAYFEVFHNSELPFVIHTGDIATTVLGTKFNISAYPENRSISVSLLEGKVKVSKTNKSETFEIAVLKPKEQLVFDKQNEKSTFSFFDSLEIVGWRYNIYKFENKPLKLVLSNLGRAFGANFEIKDKSLLDQNITIKFDNNSLQTVIDVIKSLTGSKYTITNGEDGLKEVYFY